MRARKLYFVGKGCCGIILPTHTAEVLYLDDIESLLTSERRAEIPVNVSSCTLEHFYSLSHWFGSRFAHFVSGYAQERGSGRRGSYTVSECPVGSLRLVMERYLHHGNWQKQQTRSSLFLGSCGLKTQQYISGAHRLDTD